MWPFLAQEVQGRSNKGFILVLKCGVLGGDGEEAGRASRIDSVHSKKGLEATISSKELLHSAL